MTWVWVEEHWEEVVPYSIASLLLLILIFITIFFWFRGPVPELATVEFYKQPQIVVVEAPIEGKRSYEDVTVETADQNGEAISTKRPESV